MINKSVLEQQKFKSYEIPDGEADVTELREYIRDMVIEKANLYRADKKGKITDCHFVQKYCSIPEDIYKNTINGNCKLSRNFIAKFAVGLKLGIDEANFLFALHSDELKMTNAFDFIVYHALADEDDVEPFIEDVQKYLKINLNK